MTSVSQTVATNLQAPLIQLVMKNKINNYSLGTFQADHLLFNVQYGRSNKIKNDKEDAARKLAQEETVKSGTNLFDLEERVRRGASAYALLVAEF